MNPTLGALESLDEDQRLKVQLIASLIWDAFQGGDWALARQNWETCEMDNDERIAVWSYFDSRQRAFLKGESRKYLDNDR